MDYETNLDKLRGKLAEAGVSQAFLSKKIPMSPTTLSMKMRGKSSFSVTDVSAIIRECNNAKPGIFGKEDVLAIFFAQQQSPHD